MMVSPISRKYVTKLVLTNIDGCLFGLFLNAGTAVKYLNTNKQSENHLNITRYDDNLSVFDVQAFNMV